MRRSMLSRAARVALALLFMLTLLAQSTLATEFYAIVDSFGKRPRNAYMDVAVDTRASAGGPVDIHFNVYDGGTGAQIADFFLPTNLNGFVSTTSFGNLFNLASGQPMLVRARTLVAATHAATLYLDSQGAPMNVGLLPTTTSDGTAALGMGTRFGIALGNFRSASLLIANGLRGGRVRRCLQRDRWAVWVRYLYYPADY